MAKNMLVISCDIRETRVALIEDGIIAELHIERRGVTPKGGNVGDVYLGKVTRVLPGLQAAFIDIGLERAAFLHVEDLIRPDDFEAYLAGGRRHARDREEGGNGGTGGAGGSSEEADPQELAADEAAAAEEAESIAPPALGAQDDDTPDESEIPSERGATRVPFLSEAALPPSSERDVVAVAHIPDARLPAPDSIRAPETAAASKIKTRAITFEQARNLDAGDPERPVAEDSGEVTARGAILDTLSAAAASVPAPPQRKPDAPSRSATFDKAAIASRDTLAPGAPPPNDDDDALEAERPTSPVALDAGDDEDLFDDPDLPGFTITDPDAPMPKAVAPREGGRGRGRGRGRQEGRPSGGRGPSLPPPAGAKAAPGERSGRRFDGRDGRGRGRQSSSSRSERDNRTAEAGGISRISKSTPIRDVVKEGQTIIVQITKEPISTKGARCSSHISLPGRYVVYLPTVEHIGVSKRIGSERERARLRESIEGMKPPTGGLIVRTVAEGLTKKQLKQDVGYLVRLWGEIAKTREGAKAPATLMSELDIVLKTARDLFTDEVDKIVIDDRNQYQRIVSFVEMFMPERLKDIEFYEDEEPIFDAYGIEDEIQRALSRKVPLASGGYLVIDQAEALTAIDVNTGRYVGKGAKDMEEAIVRTNLEAVEEIAYQLRFRNIGGMIILDLIDMEKASSREKIRKRLEELLQKDKAKTTLNRISELGLIEMTRKRTRESLGRLLHEPCFYCDGTGQLQSKETIAYEILREIRRKRRDLPGYTVHLNCHPAVADVFAGAEKAAIQDAENRYMRKIHINPRREYHLEQFDLVGK